jgi:hypothetical protein
MPPAGTWHLPELGWIASGFQGGELDATAIAYLPGR